MGTKGARASTATRAHAPAQQPPATNNLASTLAGQPGHGIEAIALSVGSLTSVTVGRKPAGRPHCAVCYEAQHEDGRGQHGIPDNVGAGKVEVVHGGADP